MPNILPLYDDDDGRVCWFGRTWNAPINECRHVDTPVDVNCISCNKPFESTDQGITMVYVQSANKPVVRCAYHLACHLEAVLGPSWKELTT